MPKLDEMSADSLAQSVIIYGAPFSGKTQLAAQVAKKFKVLYIDGENGSSSLLKLPKEMKENIYVQRVFDNKDTPNFIDTAVHLASGKRKLVCDKHGIVMNKIKGGKCVKCASNKDATINDWTLEDLDPSEWVVIFDSFTQLTSSANAHVTRGLKSEEDNEEFKHWRAQGKLLERFLDYVQNAPYNVIVITHEMGVEQEDGTERIMPSGGTKNFARNVAKYFNHAIYVRLRNRRHNAICNTTAETKILTGSRTGVEIDIDNPDSMCALFGK